MNPTDAVLEVRGLSKTYPKVKALHDVSFIASRGEIVGLLGPNGAGKTTLIGLILSWLYPSAGEVFVCGQKVGPNSNKALSHAGSVTGSSIQVPRWTARQHLTYLSQRNAKGAGRQVNELIEMVQLDDVADRSVSTYSTGMKQRLNLAVALLGCPELLILDEPMNGLDPIGINVIRASFRKLADQGMTILFSTHLMQDVERIADRAIVLHHGVKIEDAPVAVLTSTNTLEDKFLELVG